MVLQNPVEPVCPPQKEAGQSGTRFLFLKGSIGRGRKYPCDSADASLGEYNVSTNEENGERQAKAALVCRFSTSPAGGRNKR